LFATARIAVTKRITTTQPRKSWWFLAAILLLLFILLQLPAAWILARVSPQHEFIDHVSGNVWRGQADWRAKGLEGVVSWRLRPWEFLLLRVGADISIQTGDTQLQGRVQLGRHHWQLMALEGKVSPSTLATVMPWQWPESPIQIRQLSVGKDQSSGWTDVTGQINWGGGALGYPFEGRVEHAALPPMVGVFKQDRDRLHLALTNASQGRMGDFYLSTDHMLDVQLTQRLLSSVAGYHGQAGLDTAVISTRQPLSTLGGGM
jgi:general secretion pathway protein N